MEPVYKLLPFYIRLFKIYRTFLRVETSTAVAVEIEKLRKEL